MVLLSTWAQGMGQIGVGADQGGIPFHCWFGDRFESLKGCRALGFGV